MDNGSGRKILIIEDESDVADLLEMSFAQGGLQDHRQRPTAQAVCRRRARTGPISSFLI